MKMKKELLCVLLAGCMLTGCGSREQELLISSERKEETGSDEQRIDEQMNGELQDPQDSAEHSSENDPAFIYVDVCGAVHTPGVYELSSGSRVFEAIFMAGGLTEDASGVSINQAQPLWDGQQLYVPTIREAEESGSSLAAGSDATQRSEEKTTDKVTINTADKQTLMTLNGIGETRAEAILSYREAHGAFRTAEDLLQVSGIKEGTLAKIKDRIVTG